jgi:hypothetical protein
LLRPYLADHATAPLFALQRNALHEAWTPHDLRRTAATILDREGYSLEQIGALLAHTRKGVTAVYARWDKFDLKREMAMVLERSLRDTLAADAPQMAALTTRREAAGRHAGRPAPKDARVRAVARVRTVLRAAFTLQRSLPMRFTCR